MTKREERIKIVQNPNNKKKLADHLIITINAGYVLCPNLSKR